jgi:signal transduction histidine kinase
VKIIPASASIRTRLTVWYVAVLASVLAVYMVAVFAFQAIQLRQQLFHDEVQEVEAVEGLLFFDANGKLQLRDDYYSHPQSRLLVNRLLEVHDAHGNVIFRSSNLDGHELGRPTYPHEGMEWFERRTVKLSDGTQILMVSHIHWLNGMPLLIRLGYSLQPMDERMLHFAFLLLLAAPLALLTASIAGSGIARQALAPLESMAERAEQITASRLHERLEIQNEHDELGRMGRVLNHLLARLEQAFEQLQHFTADVAHELRTPLAALRSVGESCLQNTGTRGEPTEAISSMLEEADRLGHTIDGLLFLSRADATYLSLELTSFTLPQLIDEIVCLLEVLLEERNITIEQRGMEDSAGLIRADRNLVRGALLNVLHNAVKYSPAGSTIRVCYSRQRKDNREMQQVCIEDQGPGLAPGEHTRVFERFFRGRLQQGVTGAGLGLSIARLAVEHSGGTIFIDEAFTAGTRCCLQLPVSE